MISQQLRDDFRLFVTVRYLTHTSYFCEHINLWDLVNRLLNEGYQSNSLIEFYLDYTSSLDGNYYEPCNAREIMIQIANDINIKPASVLTPEGALIFLMYLFATNYDAKIHNHIYLLDWQDAIDCPSGVLNLANIPNCWQDEIPPFIKGTPENYCRRVIAATPAVFKGPA